MIDQVLEFLKHPNIAGSLHHFTDHRNLPSIHTHGLVSKTLASSMGLPIGYPGGNEHSHEADRIKGLTNYVNLCFNDSQTRSLESVYQASKVFSDGGPFADIAEMSPLDAKRDTRLRSSGNLAAFELEGKRFPLVPSTAFYDWIYIRSLFEHRGWIKKNVTFDAFTDIEFNPQKSLNCQARAFAGYVSLDGRDLLDKAVNDFEFFARLLPAV